MAIFGGGSPVAGFVETTPFRKAFTFRTLRSTTAGFPGGAAGFIEQAQ